MSSRTTYNCDACGKEFAYTELHALRGSVDFQAQDGNYVNVKLLVSKDAKELSKYKCLDVCAACRKPYIREYAKLFGGADGNPAD